MTTFLTIPDKIQELSKGEIKKKRISPLPAIFLILLATPFLWFGGREAFLGIESTYYFTLIGIILGVIGLILLLTPREYFVIAAPRGRIKPQIVNLDLIDKDVILELFENGQLKDILKRTTTTPGSLFLELWSKEGHDKVYAQLYESVNSLRRPITLVGVFPKESES
ncbi:MAG: hypothetical protein RR202_02980 [Bacteroidales bacterium]